MITKNSNGQTLSAGFISALTSDSRTYDAKLLLNGTELDCSISQLTVTKGSCGSIDAFTIGNVVGSTLVADVKGLTTAVKGKELEVRIGVSVSGVYEYVTLGFFTVSEAPQNIYATTITAYGTTITRTGDAFTPPATQTLANIASAISTSASALAGRTVNVTFGAGIDTTKTITASMNGLTVYQALQVLAGAVGGYAIDTYDGHIKVCRFSDTATLTRDNDTMLTLPIVEESNFEITGVLCVVTPESEDESGTVIPAVQYPATPTGNENLVLQNQYITQDLYTSYLSSLTGYEYRPATINLTYGDPRLEGDDVVQVTDIDSSVYIVPCHMITHTYTGGFSTQIVSATATEQENDIATSAGSLTEQLSSISANAISARASAESAKQSAQYASAIVSDMEDYATQAGKTLVQILDDGEQAGTAAQQALTSAQNASEYAARALGNLATVQSVSETLTWITQHGTMALTADVALNPSHVYFVVDAGGDYTVGGVTYAIVTEPDVADIGTYYELTIDESLNNYVGTHLALTSEGLWLLPAASGTNKVLIATGNGSQYTVAGTYIIRTSNGTDTVVAQFTSNGAIIGENANGKTRTEITSGGMQVVKKGTGSDIQIANLGYGAGTDSGGGTSDAPYYTFGERAANSVAGNYSVEYGNGNTANGYCSFAGGEGTLAEDDRAFAIGHNTRAKGANSFAAGTGTVAKDDKFVVGTYNKYEDTTEEEIDKMIHDNMLFIVGNGDSTTRSNAFSVDRYGDVRVSGILMANNHKNPTIVNGSNTSLSNNSVKNLAAEALFAGTYLCIGTATFAGNSTGRRGLYFSTVSGTTAGDGRYNQIEVGNAGSSEVHVQLISFIKLNTTGTLYLNARQNSGGNLNVTYPGITYIRLG